MKSSNKELGKRQAFLEFRITDPDYSYFLGHKEKAMSKKKKKNSPSHERPEICL